ncbi:MAG: aquaporin family protein [Acidobacteriaceae bacterium]|nr:aquaporin family protein [Acidobacteriaceae bacterium]
MIVSSPVLGEFVGTFVLIVLGNGVVAGALLNRSKAQNAGWISITAGWGLAVFAGVAVSTALGDPDGHLNPAVTLASVLMTGHASRLATYIPAQFLGAFLAAIVVWMHYKPHWALTEDAETKFACFATSPAVRQPVWNLFSEVAGSFILVLVATALFSKRVSPAGLAPGLGPVLVGSLVWAIGLSLGGTTGYAINPARDLGPRIAYSLLPIPAKGSSDWSYAWIPVLGPLVGASLAAGVVLLCGML